MRIAICVVGWVAVFASLFIFFTPSLSAQASGALRVSEVMHGSDYGSSWIEIVNVGGVAVSPADLSVTVHDVVYAVDAGGASSLDPGAIAVIASDAALFRRSYPSYSGPLYTARSLSFSGPDTIDLVLGTSSGVFDRLSYRKGLFVGRAGATLHVVSGAVVPAPATPGSLLVNPIAVDPSERVGSSVSTAVFGGEAVGDAVYLNAGDRIVLHVLDQGGLGSPTGSLRVGSASHPLSFSGDRVQQSAVYTVAADSAEGEVQYAVQGVMTKDRQISDRVGVVKHNGLSVIVDVTPPRVSARPDGGAIAVTVDDVHSSDHVLYRIAKRGCANASEYVSAGGTESFVPLISGQARFSVRSGSHVCLKVSDFAGNVTYASSSSTSSLPSPVSGVSGSSGSGSLAIRELLYAPVAGASHEWLEVVNEGSTAVSLTAYRIVDGDRSRTITHVSASDQIAPGGVAIIAKNPVDFSSGYPSYRGSVYKSSFSLNDAGDTIALQRLSDSVVVDSVTYVKGDGGYKNAMSLHVSSDGTVFEGAPTPGVALVSAGAESIVDAVPPSDRDVSVSIVDFERGLPIADGQNLFFTDKSSVRVTFLLQDDATSYTKATVDTYLTDVFSASSPVPFRVERDSVVEVPGGALRVTYLVHFSSVGGTASDNRVTIFPRLTDEEGNVSSRRSVAVIVRDTTVPLLEMGTSAQVLGFYDSAPVLVPVTVSDIPFGDWLRVDYGGSCGDGLLSYIAREGGHGVYYRLASGTYADCTLQVRGSAGNASALLRLPTIIVE